MGEGLVLYASYPNVISRYLFPNEIFRVAAVQFSSLFFFFLSSNLSEIKCLNSPQTQFAQMRGGIALACPDELDEVKVEDSF